MKNIAVLTISLLIAAPLSGRAADAKTNWANNCAQCHGASGKGDTKMGKMLNAMDLTDPKKQASFTDAQGGHGNQRRSQAERQNDDESLRRQVER